MKAIIVSDIHGNYSELRKIFDRESFDYIICCGDFLYGGLEDDKIISLLNSHNKKIYAARGNCDHSIDKFDFSINDFVTFPLDGMLFFMTHGHLYDKTRFSDSEYDIYIQGHTHIPVAEISNDKLYLNPGSISRPRGSSGKTYIYYDNHEFSLKKVDDGEVIKSIKF